MLMQQGLRFKNRIVLRLCLTHYESREYVFLLTVYSAEYLFHRRLHVYSFHSKHRLVGTVLLLIERKALLRLGSIFIIFATILLMF